MVPPFMIEKVLSALPSELIISPSEFMNFLFQTEKKKQKYLEQPKKLGNLVPMIHLCRKSETAFPSYYVEKLSSQGGGGD